MDKKFCFYVMFKKSFIFMIRLFKIFICCLLKCYNLYFDVVMLMKFLSEGVGGSILLRIVLCFLFILFGLLIDVSFMV